MTPLPVVVIVEVVVVVVVVAEVDFENVVVEVSVVVLWLSYKIMPPMKDSIASIDCFWIIVLHTCNCSTNG